MPLQVTEEIQGNVLEVHVTGKLERQDYEKFVPDTERLIKQYGKIRVLMVMDDFHGWDAGALWEDIKWDAKHFNDVERVAIVGERKWQEWLATMCKPFTRGTVRYFDHEKLAEARAWVEAA
jgi:stage II sporulation SpoAA-like protein